VSDAFLQNWISRVRLTSAYATQIEQSRSLSPTAAISEERIGLRSRPVRSIDTAWLGVKRAETFRMVLALMRLGQDETTKWPIYCDQAITTASSSGTTINCPTSNRRFFVGRDVLIFHLGDDGRPTQPEFRTVSAIGGSTLTLGSALDHTHPARSFVFPCLTADPSLAQGMRLYTDHVAAFDGAVLEHDEDPLPASTGAGGSAGAFGSQSSAANTEADSGTPVFAVEANWQTEVRQVIARDGARLEIGRGGAIVRQNSRPRFEYEFSLRLFSRADVFSVVKFFDSRRGRLLPFWLLSPLTFWKATAVASGSVTVEAAGSTSDIADFVSYIGVRLKDGTIHIRKLASVTDVGDFRLNITGTFSGFVLSDIDRVTIANFVRFGEDSVTEEWFTDEVADIRLRFVEVLNDLADEGLEVPIS